MDKKVIGGAVLGVVIIAALIGGGLFALIAAVVAGIGMAIATYGENEGSLGFLMFGSAISTIAIFLVLACLFEGFKELLGF